MTDRTSGGQQKLEAHVAKTLQENNIQQKDLINGMMQADDAGCCFADKTITFAFPVQPWQANRAGHLHGGIICTAFDITIAALARFFAGKNYAPTISGRQDAGYCKGCRHGTADHPVDLRRVQ